MERVQKLLVIMLVMVAGIFSSSINGQSICNVSISGLTSCRPAVTPPNPAPPTSACCSALSHADLRCLCSYKNSTLLPSLGIDPKLALKLPEKCRLPHRAPC
ncbi:hypothetical protein JCGZ_23826 [Jatropha curcas]|uniref:Bifunctional inhibitor/plant lipid transfer protein/seed storage helical domain-containing protein n=1 Tax=Jatropha curcas TaxID=180498 RepID=A0A067LFK2_JATCU|nr:putative lipid-transfer protein DIR1 [Jatropha curcas]KDP42884.1 hypothetical protein JCGZ_23826 [Jatropha curcas]